MAAGGDAAGLQLPIGTASQPFLMGHPGLSGAHCRSSHEAYSCSGVCVFFPNQNKAWQLLFNTQRLV